MNRDLATVLDPNALTFLLCAASN